MYIAVVLAVTFTAYATYVQLSAVSTCTYLVVAKNNIRPPCLNFAVYSTYMLPRRLRLLDVLLLLGNVLGHYIQGGVTFKAALFFSVYGMSIVLYATNGPFSQRQSCVFVRGTCTILQYNSLTGLSYYIHVVQ